jgi:hypothetical protein
MKIAVCLSGEPRTYETCAPGIKRFFENCDVDYFVHSVNENHWAMWSSAKYSSEYFEEVEQLNEKTLYDNLTDLFNPKSISIIDQNRSINTISQSQFYGMMMSNHLKSSYELQNNFIYDVVVRSRFDIIWNHQETFDPNLIKDQHTMYSPLLVHNPIIGNSDLCPMALDRFFAGTSNVINVITDIYRYSSYFIKRNDCRQEIVGPEHALYAYARNRNIQMQQLPQYLETIVRRNAQGLDHRLDYSKICQIEKSFFNL